MAHRAQGPSVGSSRVQLGYLGEMPGSQYAGDSLLIIHKSCPGTGVLRQGDLKHPRLPYLYIH